MWNLTREEQGVVFFIVTALLVGLGVKLFWGGIPHSQLSFTPNKLIKVKVSGAVKKPGWYALPEGSPTIEAIKMAGGPLPLADLRGLSLSSPLKDKEEIQVPQSKVNINSASLDELTSLPGIGPVLAKRIIEYRKKNGGFKDLSELKKVPGIGEVKFAQVKENITLEDNPEG